MADPADEIIVRLTADASGLSVGLDAGAAEIQAANDLILKQNEQTARMMRQEWDSVGLSAKAAADAQMQAAIQMEEIKLRLRSAMSGNIGTAEGAAVAEGRLDEAYAAGALSANEYAAAIAKLNVAQEENAAVSDVAAASSDAASASGGGFRFHGLYGTLSEGLNALLSPAGLATAAIVGVAASGAEAASKMDEMRLALLGNGDAAGVTAGEMNAWSNQMASAMGTVQDSRNAYESLARSGLFIGDALHHAGTAAIEWVEVTGSSSTQAASALERMAEDPTTALKNLTAAQAQEVESLLEMGRKAAAGRLAVEDLSADLNAQKGVIESSISVWDKFGDVMVNAWEKGSEAVKNMVGLGDLEQRIQDAKDKLHSDEQGGFLHYFMGGPLTPHASPLELLRDRAQLELLESDLKTRETMAREHADSHRAHMGAVLASAQLHRMDMMEHPHAAAVQRVDELLRHVVEGNGQLPAGVYQQGQTFSGPGFEELVRAAGGNTLPKGEHHAVHHMLHTPTPEEIFGGAPSLIPEDALTRILKIGDQQAAIETHVAMIRNSSQAAHQVAIQQLHQSHLQAMASMGTIGAQSEIAQQREIADTIYHIKLKELEREKGLVEQQPVAYARVNAEIMRLQDSHAAEMQTLNDKASAAQIKSAEATVSPVEATFSQVTAAFVEGTLTRQQAELRLGDALVAESINAGMQMLMHHIAIEEAKTIASAESHATRLALTIAGEAEAGAIHAAHAVEWIVTEAAKAAAGAFSAMAGIPYVGPFVAVAASIAAGAEVLGLVSKVASAEGGWERVPYDNAPALLHKDEMVLPAELAEGVRNMSGGGGDHYHFHINAWDGRSMGDFVRRNPGMLAQWAQHAQRTGHIT